MKASRNFPRFPQISFVLTSFIVFLSVSVCAQSAVRPRTSTVTTQPSSLELVTENNRPSPPLPVRVGADGNFSFSDIQAG